MQGLRRVAFAAVLAGIVGAGQWLLVKADVPQVAANNWASAGNFGAVPDGSAAASLADGRIVVAGGHNSDGTLVSQVGIYNPASQSWQDGGQLGVARTGHSATALDDGRVLIAGGRTVNGPSFDVEIYNPNTGQSVHAGDLWVPRVNHAAVELGSGLVLVAGGSNGSGVLDYLELFDATSGLTQSLAIRLSVAREKLTATRLLDGHVLLAGGRDGSGAAVGTAEIFASGSRSIFPTGSLRTARSGHTAVLLPNNNQVLIAGGTVNGAPSATAELYADWRDGFRAVPNPMSQARTGGVAGALPYHSLAFVGGGGSTSGEYFGYATVKTNKDDYAPGEAVVITGSGFQPGETVAIKISEDADTHYDFNYQAVADQFGRFTNSEFSPIEDDTFHHIGMRFYLVASGAASQALTTFTDGPKVTTVHMGAQTPDPVTQGDPATYGVSVTTTNNASAITDVTSSVIAGASAVPAGVSVAPGSIALGAPQDASPAKCVAGRGVPSGSKCYDSFNVSIATTSATPPGTYSLKLKLQAQGNDFADGSFTLVVLGAIRPTSTSVVCDPNPITVNASSTCTATVSDTGTGTATVPAGSVMFASNSSGTFDAASCTLSGSPAKCAVVYTATARGSGTHAITGSYTPTSSHTSSSNVAAPFNLTVNKAPQATLNLTTPASLVYGASGTASTTGGSGDGAVTYSAGSSTGCSVNATTGVITVTNATGNCAISAEKAADTNYLVATAGPNIVALEKADAEVTVTGFSGTYNAQPHGATGTAKGVGGADLSSQLNLGATFIDFPGGTANWTFTGGNNYIDESGSVQITISKADALVSVSGYSGTYDAAAHGASGTATGVGGVNLVAQLNLGATFTDAPGGTANWSFNGGTNYLDESGSVQIVINKADANVSVSGYTGTYDGNAHGATGSATGVGGVMLSGLSLGDSFTDAPGGTAHWTFNGGTNYVDESGDVQIVINKADATVTVNGFTGPYDAQPHGASGTATGVGGVDLSAGFNFGQTFTDAPGGTADWTFNGGTNYNDKSGSVAIVITKVDATVTVNGYTGTYDANAHGATGSAKGIGGVDLPGLNLGASFTNVPGGTANWTFSGGTNYNDQNGTAAIVINKADATVSVTGYTGTYDGAEHGATGTATGVGGVNLSGQLNLGAKFTNVPGGTANWTFTGGTNYNDQNGTASIVINKANQTINFPEVGPKNYGDIFTVSATASSGLLPVTFAGSGSCTVNGATVTIVSGGDCTLTASQAGNGNYHPGSTSQTLRASYNWSGVLQPINQNGSSIFKLGSTIPVKFQLTGASASITDLAARIYVAKVSNGTAGTEFEASTNAAADAGNQFRYDPSGQLYIYNWGTKLSSAVSEGTWQIRIDLLDGNVHTVIVTLKK